MTDPRPHRHAATADPLLHARTDVLLEALELGLPVPDRRGRAIAVGLYRALARGRPVNPVDLAQELGYSGPEVTAALRSWRDVVYDDHEHVVGFWGLTIQPTAHSFDTDTAHLYTWCAWDTLFLPAILNRAARVASTDPQSGQPVQLTITPSGIAARSHPGIVVSFIVPSHDACAVDVRAHFCRHVHFFTHEESARRWIAQDDDLFTLHLDAAYELGQRRNRIRGLA